jgi:hypothetical protein
MAHSGLLDYTGMKTGVMAYSFWWAQRKDGTLIPWSDSNQGLEFSAQQLMAIRNQRLEDDSSAKGRRLQW